MKIKGAVHKIHNLSINLPKIPDTCTMLYSFHCSVHNGRVKIDIEDPMSNLFKSKIHTLFILA